MFGSNSVRIDTCPLELVIDIQSDKLVQILRIIE